jgi:hypothetical protein
MPDDLRRQIERSRLLIEQTRSTIEVAKADIAYSTALIAKSRSVLMLVTEKMSLLNAVQRPRAAPPDS